MAQSGNSVTMEYASTDTELSEKHWKQRTHAPSINTRLLSGPSKQNRHMHVTRKSWPTKKKNDSAPNTRKNSVSRTNRKLCSKDGKEISKYPLLLLNQGNHRASLRSWYYLSQSNSCIGDNNTLSHCHTHESKLDLRPQRERQPHLPHP